jgi:hypothetical protein
MITTNKNARALGTAFLGRMVAAGVTPSATQQKAIRALVRSLDLIGISKFHFFYPFLGGTAATHALDLLGRFNITWSGTITHNSNGVKGNGSSGYGNTGYNPSTQSSVTNAHIGFYAAPGTHGASSSSVFGAGGGGAGFASMFTHGWFDGGTREIFAFNVNSSPNYTPTTTETKHGGHLGAGVTTGKVQQRYTDGVAISSGPTAAGTGNYLNGNAYLLARNDGSSASAFDTRTLRALHVGDYLTAGEWSDLYDAIEAYQVELGRGGE